MRDTLTMRRAFERFISARAIHVLSQPKGLLLAGLGLSVFGAANVWPGSTLGLGINRPRLTGAASSRDGMIIDFPEYGDFDAYLKDRQGSGVIVDFYANWCNPCLEAMPKVLAIARNQHSQGKQTDLVKVNVDLHEALVDRFEVNMIPCLVLVKDGKEVARLSGRKITEEAVQELFRLGEPAAE